MRGQARNSHAAVDLRLRPREALSTVHLASSFLFPVRSTRTGGWRKAARTRETADNRDRWPMVVVRERSLKFLAAPPKSVASSLHTYSTVFTVVELHEWMESRINFVAKYVNENFFDSDIIANVSN